MIWVNKQIKSIGIFSVVFEVLYIMLTALCTICFNGINIIYMAWNLFLAIVPMLIIFVYQIIKQKISHIQKFMRLLIFIMWVLFFPNCVYLVTDFSHISEYEPSWFTNYYTITGFNTWLTLIIMFLGTFVGIVVGIMSLYFMHSYVTDKFGKTKGWIFVVVMCFISGNGIYMGRFLRYNSWDILYPIKMIIRYLDSISVFYFLFVISISLLTFVIYYTVNRIMLVRKK